MSFDPKDICCWKRCKKESDIIYREVGLCAVHFSILLDEGPKVSDKRYKYILKNLSAEVKKELKSRGHV